MSFQVFLTKLANHSTSTTVLKSLVMAADESLFKKMAKWNEKLLSTAAYLDPQMRTQLDALKELARLDLRKVSINLVIFHFNF